MDLFGSKFSKQAVRQRFITEYGCPAFAKHLTIEEADEAQAKYLLGNWMDIQENIAGSKRGVGNALGGVLFEWLDEWWKNYETIFYMTASQMP